MPEPITMTIAAGIASGLATKAIMKLGQHLNDSNAAREIRKHLGIEKLHPKVEKIFQIAIYKAASPISQLDSGVVQEFVSADENQRILVKWIWDPSSIELTKDQLDRSFARKRKDRANLNHFIDRLPVALDDARHEVFEPETWAVIQELTTTVRREHGATRGHVTSEHEKTREDVAQLKQVISDLKSHQKASNEEIALEKIEESVRTDLEDSERLLEEHRLEAALMVARRSLKKIENENLSDDARRTAHERIANCYLSTPHRQNEAIDHLEAIADLTSETNVRLRNRALASLLKGDIDTGLGQIEKVLEEEPKDPDALLTQANLLAARGDEEQAADLYAEVADKEDITQLHNLGTLELQAERFERARHRALQILVIDNNHADAHLLFGISVVWERRTQIDRGEIALPTRMGELLKEAHEHLSIAIDRYEDQRPGRASMALFYRGALRIWFDESKRAQSDFRQSYKIAPTSEQTLHNLALLSYQLGDTDAGHEYVEKLKDIRQETDRSELLYLESSLLKKEGRSDEAVNLLEEQLAEGLPTGDELPVQLLLVRAYDSNVQPSEASALLAKLKADHPDDPRPHLEDGTRSRKHGDLDQAVKSFREAHALASGQLEAKARTFLADVLFQRGSDNHSERDLEEAVQIYEELATPEINNHYLRRLALGLFRLGRFGECISVCEAAQQEKKSPFLTELEARIYEAHENYEQAAKRYKWLAAKTTGDVAFLLNYGDCLHLLGRTEEARDAIDMAAGRISDDSPHEHLIVSRAYVGAGEMEEAVQHAYDALQLGEEDPQYHQYYIELFTSYGREIESRDAASEEHIQAYQRSISEYEARFPDEPFLQMMEVPEDPDKLVDQLRKQMPDTETIQAQEEAIRRHDFPVGSVAQATGRRVAETWRSLTGNSEYGVASDEGSRELLEQESGVAQSSNTVLVDLVSLLTLEYLDLLNLLETFDGLYVPQVAFNEIRQSIEHEQSRAGEERMSIRPTEDGVAISKMPAEAGDQWLDRLKRIRTFVASDNVILIGQTISRDATIEEIDDPNLVNAEYEELLGPPSAESVIESAARGLSLYADDRILRRLARAKNVNTFGTRGLLKAMADQGLISDVIHHKAMIELIQLNYYFPFVTSQMIAYGAHQDGFLPTRNGTAALKGLEHPNNDTYSLLQVSTQFLAWLWSTHEGPAFTLRKPRLTVKWTWELLDAVTKSKGPSLALTLREIMVEHVFPRLSSSRSKRLNFLRSVEIWLDNGDLSIPENESRGGSTNTD